MLRRAFAAASLAALVLGFSARVDAAGAWIASGAIAPVEQRVAVAVGPERSTLWTSLHFEGPASTVAIVVPVPLGSALDLSSDAWFEALEVATAPRIFPPANMSPYCPGANGPATIFDVAGNVGHTPSLPVQDFAVLDDAAAVSAWVAGNGLSLSPSLEAELSQLAGSRFVALRFDSPGGSRLTPTLRVAMPGAPGLIPLALTRAAADDLRVTTWVIGDGRAELLGSRPATIPPSSLAWNAKLKESNYDEERATSLSGVAGSALLECAGHDPLAKNVSIADGKASIDGVVTTFFERAAAYGDASGDPAACVATASSALASTGKVDASCPHAALGVVDPAPACTETPSPGGVNPSKLRCGASADDLAVALSGLVPANTWLTRQSLQIVSGTAGADWYLSFTVGASPLGPVRKAASVDLSDCPGGAPDGGVSTGSGAGSSSSSSSSGGVGGKPNESSDDDWYLEEPTDEYDEGYVDLGYDGDTGCGCSNGDTSSTGDGSCDGGTDTTSDGCDGGADADAGGCDGDAGGGEGCDGGDAGGDSCSGDAGGDVDCSGAGSGSSGCSGSGSDCSVRSSDAGGKRRRMPKLSIMALSAIAVLFPLRRRGRKKREAPMKK